MKTKNTLRKGFTLIELLIVISIIGILSVALIPNLSGAPARARDAARKAMISEVAAAVETYNIDTGDYPAGDACLTADHGDPSALKTLVDDYMDGLPPTQNPVTDLSNEASAMTPLLVECTDSVHYTKLASGYLLFVPLEADTGGDYNIQTLQDVAAGDAASTIEAADSLDPVAPGNAHAIIR